MAVTSAETGPPTVSQIARRWAAKASSVRASPLAAKALATKVGLVVTPESTPQAAISRISSKLAVSK